MFAGRDNPVSGNDIYVSRFLDVTLSLRVDVAFLCEPPPPPLPHARKYPRNRKLVENDKKNYVLLFFLDQSNIVVDFTVCMYIRLPNYKIKYVKLKKKSCTRDDACPLWKKTTERAWTPPEPQNRRRKRSFAPTKTRQYIIIPYTSYVISLDSHLELLFLWLYIILFVFSIPYVSFSYPIFSVHSLFFALFVEYDRYELFIFMTHNYPQ